MRTKLAVGGLVVAVLASVAVTVPALAATDTPRTARVSVAANRYYVHAGSFRQRLTTQIDVAVTKGLLTPKQAALLKAHLAAGYRWLGPQAKVLESRLLAVAAQGLGTTPAKLRAEIRSGMTFDEILRAHNKSPNALLRRIAEPLLPGLGATLRGSGFTQQQADAIVKGVEAWLDRTGAPQG